MAPVTMVLLEMQDTAVALLALIGCWLAIRRSKDGWAGAILGLALFKFPVVIPVAILLFLWRPKILRGFALSAAAVALVSVGMVGRANLLIYWRYLLGMAHETSNTAPSTITIHAGVLSPARPRIRVPAP